MLPPRQQLVARDKWPLVGERAPVDSDVPWIIEVTGCVKRPLRLSLDQLRAFPQTDVVVDIHCVTRWSKPGVAFRGVLLRDLLTFAAPTAAAQFVSFVAQTERNHDTSLPLSAALDANVLVAWEANGQPLEMIHGGPVRIVTPGRYFYKSLKWLTRIELLTEDRLGYWERTAGYHNEADPWREQRYIAAGLSKQQCHDVLASKNIAGRELLNLQAAGLELAGLNATVALLRNADFRHCNLSGACFSGANLTNARLEGAILDNVDFRNADLEGADFTGASLMNVDFTGASLLASTLDPLRNE